jgi:plasmid maintenance system antidote protein VapI
MENKRLAKAVADTNISQRKIAEELNMRPQRLSEMIHDRLKGWKYRPRLARYFHISQEVLFPEDGEPLQSRCQKQKSL